MTHLPGGEIADQLVSVDCAWQCCFRGKIAPIGQTTHLASGYSINRMSEGVILSIY